MPHRDTVIHRNGVEFFRHTARSFNLLSNQFAEIGAGAWPGTTWVKEFTTAMIGLPKSASVIRWRATVRGHPPCYGRGWWWRNDT